MNNFNMPTNKIAANALLKELQKQKNSLLIKMTRIQKDYRAGEKKKDRIDSHLGNLIKSRDETKSSLEKIRDQEAQIQSQLTHLYNNRSAARNARLKAKKSAKK